MTTSTDFVFVISHTHGFKKGYIDPEKLQKAKEKSKKDVDVEVIIA